MTKIISRPYGDDTDFWRIHQLLQQTYGATPLAFNWELRRWEGKRFYAADPTPPVGWEGQIQLWETVSGELAAAVHPDGSGDAHLQLHPHFRHLEPEIVAWAEANLSAPTQEGSQRHLYIYVNGYDNSRQGLLEALGYRPQEGYGVTRRLQLTHDNARTPPVLPAGYTLRSTRKGDVGDAQGIADLLNAAFNRDFHNAAEYLTFASHAPSFCQELDLVATTPDGSFAAYVGIPYSVEIRHATFEPVCTHPEHQRQGLARALMLAGLHRLRAMDAFDVTVETGDMIPANNLYDSLGFTEKAKGRYWRKMF